MERIDVYAAIDSERDYQDTMTASAERPDMVEIGLGEIILAAEHNLALARHHWYYGSGQQSGALEHLRKVAGLAVKAGELYGMPRR